MERPTDLATIGAVLNVNVSVLNHFCDLADNETVVNWVLSSENETEFWTRIDSLSPDITLAVHREAAKIENLDKDFTPDLIQPIIFDYYQAHSISTGTEPIPANPVALSLSSIDAINNILSQTSEWSFNQTDKTWTIKGEEFSPSSLLVMCNAYIIGGNTWLFCPYLPIQQNYQAIFALMNSLDNRFMTVLNPLLTKMKQLLLTESSEFVDALKSFLAEEELSSIGEFKLDSDIVSALSNLLDISSQVARTDLAPAPHDPIDETTMVRADALTTQMALPFPQRTAFALTPQILGARCGYDVEENPFDAGSLTELLFCGAAGEPAPMPYQNRAAEQPTAPPDTFCHGAMRRWAALKLREGGFEAATEGGLEVLADCLQELTRGVAAAVGGGESEVDAVKRAIELSGLDSTAALE